ncbi:helix-turn-helix domain-containing protein [Acholeplasma hippikon]|uniref:Transposase and inactivated derivatives n=2 Tax=Acholeplasma hippikon TaxID=264636 RepID=A0A449BJP8_9MOLU|nr:helix-turn-helix domain-containing protein [Acholeplasma hippikon]VEU82691.1 Transposase and inactivated derivatives [Acholeplasma hippikon]
MRKNKRLSYEEKILICTIYEKGEGSLRQLASQFGVSKSAIEVLIFKYSKFGAEALRMQGMNQSYTETLKNEVVESYRNGAGRYYDLALKYGIRNPSLIARWVLGYNNIKTTHSESGGIDIMGRKTTLDERVKIVEYLIQNEFDYQGTSLKFEVSYQQVYTWYKKYQVFGVDGLSDKRGRKKQPDELSELEKLRRENERLKKELYLSEAAKKVFKKKQELEAKAHLTRLETKKHMKQ